MNIIGIVKIDSHPIEPTLSIHLILTSPLITITFKLPTKYSECWCFEVESLPTVKKLAVIGVLVSESPINKNPHLPTLTIRVLEDKHSCGNDRYSIRHSLKLSKQ